MAASEKVEVVDLEMLTVVPTWPSLNEESYIALLRFSYCITGQTPVLEDFEFVSAKDAEAPSEELGFVYGLKMRGIAVERKEMERQCIAYFIVNKIGYPHVPKEVDELAKSFSCWPPHSGHFTFYFRWALATPEHFATLRREFHERDSAISPAGFVVSPARPLIDCVGCRHVLPHTTRGASPEERRQAAIEEHIRGCLNKKAGDSDKLAAYLNNPWRAHPPEGKRNATEEDEVKWSHFQPYFRCVAREKNGFLLLPEDMVKSRLSEAHQAVYQSVRAESKDQEKIDEQYKFWGFSTRELERMKERYEFFGYDNFDFLRMDLFTLPERLYFLARPPPPCSSAFARALSASSSSSKPTWLDSLLLRSINLSPPALLLEKGGAAVIMKKIFFGEQLRPACTILCNRRLTPSGAISRVQTEPLTYMLAIRIYTPDYIEVLKSVKSCTWKLVLSTNVSVSAITASPGSPTPISYADEASPDGEWADEPAALEEGEDEDGFAGHSSVFSKAKAKAKPKAKPKATTAAKKKETKEGTGAGGSPYSPTEAKTELSPMTFSSGDVYMCVHGYREILCCLNDLSCLFYLPYDCFVPFAPLSCTPDQSMWNVWKQVVPPEYLPVVMSKSSSRSGKARTKGA